MEKAGARAAEWEEKRNFFESDSEAGWLWPRRPAAGGEGDGKCGPDLRNAVGQEGQGRGGPGGGQCLGGDRGHALLPLGSPTSCPDFPDHSLGADWYYERLESGFFPLICPNSPWKRAGPGFAILCAKMFRLREGKDFCWGHTALALLIAVFHCCWSWGQEGVSPGNSLKTREILVLVLLPHYQGSQVQFSPRPSGSGSTPGPPQDGWEKAHDCEPHRAGLCLFCSLLCPWSLGQGLVYDTHSIHMSSERITVSPYTWVCAV